MTNVADSPSPTPLVALEGVTKRFGAVTANNNVSFAVMPGEVVALIGENGAGKSTLVNMLSGLLGPDAGTIRMDGAPVRFASPAQAVAAGIGVVHQHFMLVPTLSALDNIALGMPELGLGPLPRVRLRVDMVAVAGRLGFQVDPDARIDSLDVAHQQRIEIIKALMHDVRLLVLDEPTAVLGPEDRQHLFDTIRRLRTDGTAIVLITHKLDDVHAVADRVVILRGGSVSVEAATATLTPRDIVRHMVGSRDAEEAGAIVQGRASDAKAYHPERVVCRIRDLALRRANGSVAVSGLSLDLHAGEIVAVAGVDGNGQTELVRCLAGLFRPDEGVVEALGETTGGRGWSAGRLRARGLAHIPEDRRRSAIVADMTLARNYLLGHFEGRRFTRFGLVSSGPLTAAVSARLSEFRVKSSGPGDLMERLSGGNQQKVVLARELDGDPRLILAAHPSRGLDLKTIHFVHEQLERARDAGKAVLLLSADLDEIMQLADRIVVFADGRVFGPALRSAVDRAKVGAWIAGHQAVPA